MNRLWGVSLAGLLSASCSSTTAAPSAGGGASGSVGASAAGSGGTANLAGSAGRTAGSAGADPAGQAGMSTSGAGGSNAAGKGSGGAGASAVAGSSGAAGAGGSGGSAGAPTKYCDTHPLASAPFTMTDHFDDEYVGDASAQVTEYALPDVCDEPAEANAVGTCGEWQYSPKATGATTVKLQWLADPIGVKYAPTCLAPG